MVPGRMKRGASIPRQLGSGFALVQDPSPQEVNNMDEGILSTIGNTPLIRLSRIFTDSQFDLYAKLEGLNPGGSTKDRPALNILKAAMAEGKIGPDTVIIESSSGNL